MIAFAIASLFLLCLALIAGLNLFLLLIALLLAYGAVSMGITVFRRDIYHVIVTATSKNFYFTLTPEIFILFSSESQNEADALARDIKICLERKT
jgi:hypothetical protein